MNRKTYSQRQEILRLLDNAYNKDINKVKLSAANTKAHEMKKCEVCYDLLVNNKSFVSEARFKHNQGRCDVLCLEDGIGYEVVCTEKEESLLKKANKYPVPLEIIRLD